MSKCKYYKQQRQVSYDNGATWMNVVPEEYQMGDLYEPDSPDCNQGESLIRWRLVPGDFICEGKNKYQKEIEEYSTDNGETWRSVYPTTYRKATLIEANSDICNNKWEGHYADEWYKPSGVCPKWYKWVDGVGCVYVDPVKIIRCSSSTSTTLTNSEVLYYTSSSSASWITNTRYELLNGIIGDCVTELYWSFASCSALTEMVIPDTVTNIGNNSFQNCYALESVNIPSGVTNIGQYAFEHCHSLTEVTIPSGVTNIGTYAFYGCSRLTSITVEATTPPTLGSSALDSTNNCPIYVPCQSLETYRSTYPWNYYLYRLTGIPPCDIPPVGAKIKLTYNDSSTYSGECSAYDTNVTTADTRPTGHSYTAITSAEIGDCVTGIGTRAFSGCTNMTAVTIPDSVTGIGSWSFNYCYSLTSVTIPDSVTIVDSNAFRETGLVSVTIGSGVTSIGGYAFNSSSSLTGITINATTPPTLGNSAFVATNNCPIYVPCESVQAYLTASTWSEYSSRIQGLSPVTIYRWYPSGTTCVGYDKYRQAIKQVSNDCGKTWADVSPVQTSATTLIEANSIDCGYTPPSITGKFFATYSGGQTYSADCDSNTTLTSGNTIPSGYDRYNMNVVVVGSCVTTIGRGAFQGCNNLTRVVLPDTVTSFANYAFNNTATFELVIPYDGVVSLPDRSKYPLPSGGGAFVTVKVPSNRVQDYNNDTRWTAYVNNGLAVIQAIS